MASGAMAAAATAVLAIVTAFTTAAQVVVAARSSSVVGLCYLRRVVAVAADLRDMAVLVVDRMDLMAI